MTVKYEIKFLDYWHLSSGLSAGVKHDSLVVKDMDGLPFVPGKTFKGLVKEMAELLGKDGFVKTCFGREGVEMGACYFTNAKIDEAVKKQIVSNNLKDNLYDEIASTQIEDGMAVDNSLREIEVVIPISLHGEINDVPSEYITELKQSLRMIKRMGLNRNRGLGRCSVIVEDA
ncbi:MAG TPA: CRISPR-associated protein [Campylobacterales bacterium]|nr:CRISPR-associated protein [Campylobacterales bacterium]